MRAYRTEVLDCTDQTLGKVIQRTCSLLRGSDLCSFTPTDPYRNVTYVNLIHVDRLKPIDPYRKVYSHTRFGGGFKVVFAHEMLKRNPSRYVKIALRGQLPKGRSRHLLLRRLRVYAGNGS